jgi:hypothetical protein
MRALLLVAALVVSGCRGEGPPGGPPDALTIGWLPNPSLPTYSTDPVIAYTTGVSLPCRVGGYIAFHADVHADANTSTVRLAIAKVDANGNETAVGSPAPLAVVASEPPPTGLKTVIFKPIAVSDLCATLTAGDYHARIVAPDGTVLAFGHFTLGP